jgi:hypothetical protein
MFILLIAAALTFDTQMSEKEKSETGIAKLTFQEKMALQNWIEDHQPSKKTGKEKKSDPILQEVLKNGRFIRLSDNSLWEIDPADTPITQSWITPIEIKATPTNHPDYPYHLTNTLTGSMVKARKTDNPIPKES